MEKLKRSIRMKASYLCIFSQKVVLNINALKAVVSNSTKNSNEYEKSANKKTVSGTAFYLSVEMFYQTFKI